MRTKVKVSYYNPIAETMSREELLGWQWRKTKYQLEYLYHTNPFYRRKLQQARIAPDDIQNMEDFRHKVPFTTKEEVIKDQEEVPPFGTRLGIPRKKIALANLTSGTSGLGQEVYGLTRADLEYGGGITYCLYWSGMRRGDVWGFALPLALHLSGSTAWVMAFQRLGLNGLFLGPFDTKKKIEMMRRFGLHGMLIVPAYLTRVTIECQEMGLAPCDLFPRLKGLNIGTEPYSVGWAQKMEEVWGTRLFETYGSSQLGGANAGCCEYGALPGGKRGVVHWQEHLWLGEVVDRANRRPVAPGEEGEFVATPFEREGSPLLRFLSDDRVRYMPYNACPCGRPFDGFEAGTISRWDDMMKIKGVNIWPAAVDGVLFGYDEVAEYQGRVFMTDRGEQEVEVKVEFRRGVRANRKRVLLPRIAGELKEKVGVRMVVAEATDRLPKFEFKTRRWTDERLRGLERVLYVEKES